MPSRLAAAFQQLDRVISDNQELWRPQPFTCDTLPWGVSHPHVREALLNLSDTRVIGLHDDPQQRLHWFRQIEPDLCAALYAFEPSPTDAVAPPQLNSFDDTHIPGRKLQQVTAFAAAMSEVKLPLVDWCAGKGHLSRLVQRSQNQPVHCLEWNAALLAQGEDLARKQNLDICYHQHDVMQALPAECAESNRVHIGLHACGKLHHRMLQHVASTSAAAVMLSPCCYHKIATEQYQPLSHRAQRSGLVLDLPSLHLAVQDTATARRGERLIREQERLWRLAFDALQRDVRGVDEYLNVHSCRREILRQDFAGFCRWAASRRQLALPDGIDYARYLELGRTKHREVTRLELLRQLFKRPLELWLVLDCALYLEQHGYSVNVSTFCGRTVSPRNLLIQGILGSPISRR